MGTIHATMLSKANTDLKVALFNRLLKLIKMLFSKIFGSIFNAAGSNPNCTFSVISKTILCGDICIDIKFWNTTNVALFSINMLVLTLVKCCGILKHVWNGAPDHWVFSILFANTTHNRFYLVIPSLLDLDSFEIEFLEAKFHCGIQYRAMFHLNSVLSLTIHGYFQLSEDDLNTVFCRSTNNFVKRTFKKPFPKSLPKI